MNEKIEIDANPYIMEDCSQAYKDGDVKKARNMQKAFIKAIKESGQDHCPCKEACQHHGRCEECVLLHRAGMDHVPLCFRNLINEKLRVVSSRTEHSLKEIL